MGRTVQQGTWGGPYGANFDMGPQPNILGFNVWSDDQYINGIQFQYGQNSGQSSWTPVYGTQIGTSQQISFQPNERLIGIGGTLDQKVEAYVVRSLTFYTTVKTYGPYGTEEGSAFTFKSTGPIVGFFGRSAQQINAIGIYIEP